MKQIQLVMVELENFKCHRELELQFLGKNCTLLGGNGAGKTAVYDALGWLLFDRDAGIQGTANGAVTGVGALIKAGENDWWFRRTLQGSCYEYFVDGVPYRRADYWKKVRELAPDLWLLSDVHHFSRDLHWRQRRELLFQAAGLPSDEILLEEPRFRILQEAAGGLPLEAYREELLKGIRAQKELRRELTARGLELQTQIQELENRDYDALRLAWEEARRADPVALEAERKTRQRLREELRRAEAESRFSGDCPVCGQGLQAEALEHVEARRREAQERVELLHRELESDFEDRWNARSDPDRLEALGAQLAGRRLLLPARQRLETLRQGALGAEAQRKIMEEDLDALETFYRCKARLLPERLEPLFGAGRIRLFRIRPDGRLEDGCDVLWQGIPYERLSTGEQVNTGLEIIGAFSRLWEVAAPVLVDNAEGVSSLGKAPGQVIRFVTDSGPLRLERG